MIYKIPTLSTSQEVSFDERDPQQSDLRQKLLVHLGKSWRIVDSRYFLVSTRKPTWDAIRHFGENSLSDITHVKKIGDDTDGDDRDSTSYVVFATGWIFREYVAVAMDDKAVDGKWIIGYFSLKKSGFLAWFY